MNNKYIKFALGDVFDIKSPKKRFNANTVKFGGKHPYVVRSSANNGIRGYITEDEKYLSPAKSLSFGQDTATIFYQPVKYFTGDKIKVMVLRNRELNDRLAQYFLAAISKAFQNFSWGQSSFNEDIIKLTKISLPVIESSDPNHEYTPDDIDWQYMQERIKELEQERIKELEQERIKELDAYLKASGLNDYELTDEDKEVLSLSTKCTSDEANALAANCKNRKIRFKNFRAIDLFDIKKGKRLTKADMVAGKINFIGSSATNNGITARVGNTEYLHPAHTVTVSYNGSVGEVFLQDERFWASDDVNVWYPKFHFNTEVIEYMMAVIKKCREKYSYSAKWTLEKMKEEKLRLPVKANDQIDFDYMERYIRAMEKVVIKEVVEFKDKWIETTMKVVARE